MNRRTSQKIFIVDIAKQLYADPPVNQFTDTWQYFICGVTVLACIHDSPDLLATGRRDRYEYLLNTFLFKYLRQTVDYAQYTDTVNRQALFFYIVINKTNNIIMQGVIIHDFP